GGTNSAETAQSPAETNSIPVITTPTNVPVLSATNAPAGTVDERISETVMLKLSDVLKMIVKWFGDQLGNVRTWAEFLLGFFVAPVCLFYFLLEKPRIQRRWTDYLPIHESKAKDELVFVLNAINDCMIVFFRGQVLVAACVGILLTIGYLIMGLHYAVLLGVVAATLGIVPYLGTIITLALALSVAAVQFGDWTHPLLVLGIAAGVKVFEDFVISPKIMGDRAGLHPLTIIIAVMVGTTVLGGILGALLSIPLTAALRTLMFRYVWKEKAGNDLSPP
ncbi:MAG TPA: AI-2E family transporter, partial [Verrucomicrobiae bacterium]|nr:AI-2E family transporter [Verrucomicrobiae bacterium]